MRRCKYYVSSNKTKSFVIRVFDDSLFNEHYAYRFTTNCMKSFLYFLPIDLALIIVSVSIPPYFTYYLNIDQMIIDTVLYTALFYFGFFAFFFLFAFIVKGVYRNKIPSKFVKLVCELFNSKVSANKRMRNDDSILIRMMYQDLHGKTFVKSNLSYRLRKIIELRNDAYSESTIEEEKYKKYSNQLKNYHELMIKETKNEAS